MIALSARKVVKWDGPDRAIQPGKRAVSQLHALRYAGSN